MLTIFSGKKLFFPVAALLAVFLLWAFSQTGDYVKALPLVMRPTAHAAFLLFFAAFTASSIQRLSPGAYGRWAMRNRRYIGLNFALVHFVHAGLVLSNLAFTEASRPLLVLAAGGTAYVFLFLMTITSNSAAIRKLGAKNWKRLHKIGSYYIWVLFAATTFRQPEPFTSLGTSYVAILLLTALALRIAAHRKSKSH